MRKLLMAMSLFTAGLLLAGMTASVPSQAAEGKLKKETKAAVGAAKKAVTWTGKEAKAAAGAAKKAAAWTGKEVKAGASAVKKAVTHEHAKVKKTAPKAVAKPQKKTMPKTNVGAGKPTTKPPLGTKK
ncbi:MAG: hypothetical protein ACP5R4_05315 [Armatimonadota bacterium]